ncbi:MAG TPA: FAD-dependent oxidoreductase [Thermoanaerobaculia bacterium]|nr:FAD-dependent oxidoreductase [Thermoanaerobaculia bacterium]
MQHADVVVVGAGLAGLSCGIELGCRGRGVLLLEGGAVVGGRTSSWNDRGMDVESGLHRMLGFYAALPALLRQAGLDVDDIVYWEDEVEIRLPDGRGSGVFGAAPLYRPFETLAGALGNFEILSVLDRVTLAAFISAGLVEYFANPAGLDQWNVRAKAEAAGVTESAIQNVLVPLTSGLYFLPPERYSAYAFFGTLGPYLARLFTVRVGAFLGGMTEVLAAPLAAAIVQRGGEVRTRAKVTRLLTRNGRVTGVEIGGGERIAAEHVVLAASLAPAQQLVRQAFGGHSWFEPMLRLPSMPAVTIQLELDVPPEPRAAVDHPDAGRAVHPDAPRRDPGDHAARRRAARHLAARPHPRLPRRQAPGRLLLPLPRQRRAAPAAGDAGPGPHPGRGLHAAAVPGDDGRGGRLRPPRRARGGGGLARR